jgi:hypothetical protein
MLSERLQQRLRRDRPTTSITLRIPVDVVELLKAIAPRKGLSGYQVLLKSYVSEGLRRDEALLDDDPAPRLLKALRRQGVSEAQLDAALRELQDDSRARRADESCTD